MHCIKLMSMSLHYRKQIRRYLYSRSPWYRHQPNKSQRPTPTVLKQKALWSLRPRASGSAARTWHQRPGSSKWTCSSNSSRVSSRTSLGPAMATLSTLPTDLSHFSKTVKVRQPGFSQLFFIGQLSKCLWCLLFQINRLYTDHIGYIWLADKWHTVVLRANNSWFRYIIT